MAASAPTKPSSAEPRLVCQGSPRVQPRDVGDARLLPDLPVDHYTGYVQPAVVGTEPGRPHHCVHRGHAAVREACRAAGEAGQPGAEVDATTAQGAGPAADDQVAAGLQPAAAGLLDWTHDARSRAASVAPAKSPGSANPAAYATAVLPSRC